MIRLLILLSCLLTIACTPLKHKTIDKTYHGTNGNGGYWLAWLTKDVVKGDSVVIRVTGYNVEEHIIEKQNIVAFVYGDSVTFPEVTKTPLGEKLIRVVPGKYQLGFVPSRLSLPFRTKRFHLKAGDSLTVAFNSVWNYQPPMINDNDEKGALKRMEERIKKHKKEQTKKERKEARKQKRKKNE